MANVSQKTIAARLGINEATVSLALKDHPRVSSRTREAVHAAARELGYTDWTNREIRATLSRRWNKPVRTGIIVIVNVDSASEPSMLRAPYFDAYMHGIEAEAAERDLSILTCPFKPGKVLTDAGLFDERFVYAELNGHGGPYLTKVVREGESASGKLCQQREANWFGDSAVCTGLR